MKHRHWFQKSNHTNLERYEIYLNRIFNLPYIELRLKQILDILPESPFIMEGLFF